MTEQAQPNKVVVWDVPVRVVHWSFVALLPALWWSAETRQMDLHFTLGLTMLGLVVFRLVWGVIGSSTARFKQFVTGPGAILRYLKTPENTPHIGHNPLGALSVVTLLALLGAQVGLGLFAQDTDAVSSGPLNHLVSWDTATAASDAHGIVFNVLLAIIALHVAAIAFYRFVRKNDLVTPMISGRRAVATSVTQPSIASWIKALSVAIIAAALALWISFGVPPWGAKFPWEQADMPVDVPSADSYM
ncbi:cytochrome b/b6 domain-containing protein [Novosphingobium sp. AAP83]|uniref:cytochrome b/b6 domain-containing protein n=1 Tax=Novosphingobium sp. AAP83 TaxID=1523425 RepID=UPI0009E7596E|nr:cytochrome b/b6 domain-containing protein [Novosphingobium sp. AAP83]